MNQEAELFSKNLLNMYCILLGFKKIYLLTTYDFLNPSFRNYIKYL